MQGSARKDVVRGAARVYIVVLPGPKWKSWLYTKVAKTLDIYGRFGMTRRVFTGLSKALIASLNVPSSRRSSFSSRALG